MKKEYQKPEMKAIEIKSEQILLSASGAGIDYQDDYYGPWD